MQVTALSMLGVPALEAVKKRVPCFGSEMANLNGREGAEEVVGAAVALEGVS